MLNRCGFCPEFRPVYELNGRHVHFWNAKAKLKYNLFEFLVTKEDMEANDRINYNKEDCRGKTNLNNQEKTLCKFPNTKCQRMNVYQMLVDNNIVSPSAYPASLK